ncbi:MAG: hypothetical protein GWN58_35565 [Anaerolineae bacterium]|nr:hypothetical protein [Anaerolineae bacterium]
MRLMLDQGVAFATATRAILAPHYRSEAAQRRLLTQALGEHALEQIEASGRLDLFAEEFQDVSLNFHRQLMARMNRNSRLAEIGLIIFIGVIVGLMVIAIYLPIFKMGGAI